MTSAQSRTCFHRVHSRSCTFIGAGSVLRTFRSYYEVWKNASAKWFVVMSSSYQRHSATSPLIGLQPIRSISILTDLYPCIRVSTPPISWELTPSRAKRSDAAKVILLSLPAKGFGKKKKGLRTPSGIESRQEFHPDHAFGRRTQRFRGREGFGESRDLQH
jgi:hypothetical protein